MMRRLSSSPSFATTATAGGANNNNNNNSNLHNEQQQQDEDQQHAGQQRQHTGTPTRRRWLLAEEQQQRKDEEEQQQHARSRSRSSSSPRPQRRSWSSSRSPSPTPQLWWSSSSVSASSRAGGAATVVSPSTTQQPIPPSPSPQGGAVGGAVDVVLGSRTLGRTKIEYRDGDDDDDGVEANTSNRNNSRNNNNHHHWSSCSSSSSCCSSRDDDNYDDEDDNGSSSPSPTGEEEDLFASSGSTTGHQVDNVDDALYHHRHDGAYTVAQHREPEGHVHGENDEHVSVGMLDEHNDDDNDQHALDDGGDSSSSVLAIDYSTQASMFLQQGRLDDSLYAYQQALNVYGHDLSMLLNQQHSPFSHSKKTIEEPTPIQQQKLKQQQQRQQQHEQQQNQNHHALSSRSSSTASMITATTAASSTINTPSHSYSNSHGNSMYFSSSSLVGDYVEDDDNDKRVVASQNTSHSSHRDDVLEYLGNSMGECSTTGDYGFGDDSTGEHVLRHCNAASCLRNMGAILRLMGRNDEAILRWMYAERLYRQAKIDVQRRIGLTAGAKGTRTTVTDLPDSGRSSVSVEDEFADDLYHHGRISDSASSSSDRLCLDGLLVETLQSRAALHFQHESDIDAAIACHEQVVSLLFVSNDDEVENVEAEADDDDHHVNKHGVVGSGSAEEGNGYVGQQGRGYSPVNLRIGSSASHQTHTTTASTTTAETSSTTSSYNHNDDDNNNSTTVNSDSPKTSAKQARQRHGPEQRDDIKWKAGQRLAIDNDDHHIGWRSVLGSSMMSLITRSVTIEDVVFDPIRRQQHTDMLLVSLESLGNLYRTKDQSNDALSSFEMALSLLRHKQQEKEQQLQQQSQSSETEERAHDDDVDLHHNDMDHDKDDNNNMVEVYDSIVHVLKNLSEIYLERGELDRSVDALHDAMDIKLSTPEPVVTTTIQHSSSDGEGGDFPSSSDGLERPEQQHQHNQPPSSDLLDAMDKMGYANERLMNYDKALSCYEKTALTRSRYLGEDHIDVAKSLINVGRVMELQGNVDGSIDVYRAAHGIYARQILYKADDEDFNMDDVDSLLRLIVPDVLKQRRYEEAVGYLNRCLEVIDNHEEKQRELEGEEEQQQRQETVAASSATSDNNTGDDERRDSWNPDDEDRERDGREGGQVVVDRYMFDKSRIYFDLGRAYIGLYDYVSATICLVEAAKVEGGSITEEQVLYMLQRVEALQRDESVSESCSSASVSSSCSDSGSSFSCTDDEDDDDDDAGSRRRHRRRHRSAEDGGSCVDSQTSDLYSSRTDTVTSTANDDDDDSASVLLDGTTEDEDEGGDEVEQNGEERTFTTMDTVKPSGDQCRVPSQAAFTHGETVDEGNEDDYLGSSFYGPVQFSLADTRDKPLMSDYGDDDTDYQESTVLGDDSTFLGVAPNVENDDDKDGDGLAVLKGASVDVDDAVEVDGKTQTNYSSFNQMIVAGTTRTTGESTGHVGDETRKSDGKGDGDSWKAAAKDDMDGLRLHLDDISSSPGGNLPRSPKRGSGSDWVGDETDRRARLPPMKMNPIRHSNNILSSPLFNQSPTIEHETIILEQALPSTDIGDRNDPISPRLMESRLAGLQLESGVASMSSSLSGIPHPRSPQQSLPCSILDQSNPSDDGVPSATKLEEEKTLNASIKSGSHNCATAASSTTNSKNTSKSNGRGFRFRVNVVPRGWNASDSGARTLSPTSDGTSQHTKRQFIRQRNNNSNSAANGESSNSHSRSIRNNAFRRYVRRNGFQSLNEDEKMDDDNLGLIPSQSSTAMVMTTTVPLQEYEYHAQLEHNSPVNFVAVRRTRSFESGISEITFRVDDTSNSSPESNNQDWWWGVTAEGFGRWFPTAYVSKAVEAAEGFLSAKAIHAKGRRTSAPPLGFASDAGGGSSSDDDGGDSAAGADHPSHVGIAESKSKARALVGDGGTKGSGKASSADRKSDGVDSPLSPCHGSFFSGSPSTPRLAEELQMEITMCVEKLRKLKEEFGKIHPQVATSLFTLAVLRSRNREISRALDSAMEALRIQKTLGKTEDAIRTIHFLADLYLHQKQCKSALLYYTEALKQEREHYGLYSEEAARTHNCIGTVRSMQNEFALAMESHEEALRILKEVHGEDIKHPLVSQTLCQIGSVYYRERNSLSTIKANDYSTFIEGGMLEVIGRAHEDRGSYKMAISFFEEKLQFLENKAGEEDLEEAATTLNSLGMLCARAGLLLESADYYEKALIIQLQLGCDKVHLATARVLTAAVRFQLGAWKESQSILEEALGVLEQELGDEHETVAAALYQIGLVHIAFCDHSAAMDCLKRALDIQNSLLGEDHPATLRTRRELANVLAVDDSGIDTAFFMLREVVVIQRRIHGDRHPNVAETLHHIGCIHSRRGEFSSALKMLEECYYMRVEFLGWDHPLQASTLHEIAAIHLQRGRLKKATHICEVVLGIRKESLGERHVDVARTMMMKGCCLVSMGDVAVAMETFEEAISIAKDSVGPAHPLVGDLYAEVGTAHLRKCQFENARKLIEDSLTVYRNSKLQSNHASIRDAEEKLARVRRDEMLCV